MIAIGCIQGAAWLRKRTLAKFVAFVAVHTQLFFYNGLPWCQVRIAGDRLGRCDLK